MLFIVTIRRYVSVFLCFVFVLCSLIGCSSKPSEEDAKKVFEAKHGGCNQVLSFRKTNGIEQEKNFYTIEYEADVIPQAPCSFGFYGCKKDDITVIYGNIYFTKTEKGWKGVVGDQLFKKCITRIAVPID